MSRKVVITKMTEVTDGQEKVVLTMNDLMMMKIRRITNSQVALRIKNMEANSSRIVSDNQ